MDPQATQVHQGEEWLSFLLDVCPVLVAVQKFGESGAQLNFAHVVEEEVDYRPSPGGVERISQRLTELRRINTAENCSNNLSLLSVCILFTVASNPVQYYLHVK